MSYDANCIPYLPRKFLMIFVRRFVRAFALSHDPRTGSGKLLFPVQLHNERCLLQPKERVFDVILESTTSQQKLD